MGQKFTEIYKELYHEKEHGNWFIYNLAMKLKVKELMLNK